jgi:hypothetical protein
MHGDQRVARTDRGRVEIQGLRVDVDEVGVRTDEAGAVRAGNERQWRGEDAIAGSDTGRRERSVQRGARSKSSMRGPPVSQSLPSTSTTAAMSSASTSCRPYGITGLNSAAFRPI